VECGAASTRFSAGPVFHLYVKESYTNRKNYTVEKIWAYKKQSYIIQQNATYNFVENQN